MKHLKIAKNTIKEKYSLILARVSMMIFSIAALQVPVFAAGATGDGAITTPDADFIKIIFGTLFVTLSQYFTLIAVVILSVCLIIGIFGTGNKSAEKSFGAAKTTVVVWVIFSTLGAIVKYADTLLAPFRYTI